MEDTEKALANLLTAIAFIIIISIVVYFHFCMLNHILKKLQIGE